MKIRRLRSDVINMLPQNIIETILTLMPIQDAVRTSILSRKWRYNWVKIPKLVFDDKTLVRSTSNDSHLETRLTFFFPIYQVLLLHHGPVIEFTLDSVLYLDVEEKKYWEIDQIIYHLSKSNTVKKLTLDLGGDIYKVPSSFCSLNQLTDLTLVTCEIEPPSTFNGFSMLTSLYMGCVYISAKMLVHLLSGCPLLKSINLLELYMMGEEKSSIAEFLQSLPMIEELYMMCDPSFQCFLEGEIPQKLPTSLVHLTYLDLSTFYMFPGGFSFILLMIRSSPKLEKFTIQVTRQGDIEELMGFLELQDYSDVWLDHLTEFEFKIRSGMKRIPYSEFYSEFLKLILVKSPILKKVRIELYGFDGSYEEIKMLGSLSQFPRASQVVEFITYPAWIASGRNNC